MKQILALTLVVALLCYFTGCKEPAPEAYPTRSYNGVPVPEDPFHESGGNLTMATLISLVDIYGEDLTWDTFAPYWHEDIGSGIYVLCYTVDTDYCLMISGTSMENPPARIALEAIHAPSLSIDPRTESIGAFVATGAANRATQIAKEDALNTALEHCKTTYDYTEMNYSIFMEEWRVEFWETDAKVAAQTIIVKKNGDVVKTWFAE